jgi:uncharacterized protein (DUF697 family)/GTP-binding protein EngB required for normal cell division
MSDAFAIYGLIDAARREVAREIGRVNIVVAGLAGIGKSTLINGVFGARCAPVGIGRSVTTATRAYQEEDNPLRVYDTRGFEIRNAHETIAAVRDLIVDLRGSHDANDQIHVAWLGILEQSHRVEPVHLSLLALLRSLDVAAVVVITQALGDDEMERSVRELAVPRDGLASVLAEPKTIAGHTFPPHGVADLVSTSLTLLPKAHASAFIAAQKVNWDLKREAIVASINTSAMLAGGSALAPVAGGHSVALLAIQVRMIVRINTLLGLSLSASDSKGLIGGILGILAAKMGGQAAFRFTLTEAMRLVPGIGWLGAAMIGGPIGAAATKTLGHLYFDTVAAYAKRDQPLPSADALITRMQRVLSDNVAKYETIGSEPR